MFFPDLQIGDAGSNTIIKALQKIQAEGRTRIVMIAGSDRVAEFQKLLNQYNGKPDKQGNDLYKFDSIDVVSAGQRDPDQEGVAGASASKARDLANKGQEQEFNKIVLGGNNGKKLYDIIQDRLAEQIDENNKKLYNEDMADGKPTVYLDMDGVLADFFGGVEKMYGVEHWKQLTNDKTKDLKKVQQVIESFREGTIGVITAKLVVDEGFNVPEIEVAYLLSSTTVERQWTQRRGRVLRLSPSTNKEFAVIHDFLVLPPNGNLSEEGISMIRRELSRCQTFWFISDNVSDFAAATEAIERAKSLIN